MALESLGSLLHDPALDALTKAVRTITGLLQPSMIAVDLADLRVILHPDGLDGVPGGGRAVLGTGEAARHERARIAAERALADLRRSYAAR